MTRRRRGAGIESQPACKPGSVWRLSCRKRQKTARDDHSSGTSITGRLMQPTRTTPRRRVGFEPCRPYSVLLPAGLAMPPTLPPARCALTAPFHPCPGGLSARPRRFAFCGAFPGVAPAGRYPAPHPYGARTFLRPYEKDGGRPADWPCRDRGGKRPRSSGNAAKDAPGCAADRRNRQGDRFRLICVSNWRNFGVLMLSIRESCGKSHWWGARIIVLVAGKRGSFASLRRRGHPVNRPVT